MTARQKPLHREEVSFDRGSYRDRSSRVCYAGGAVIRALDARAASNWERLAQTDFFARHVADGRMVRTWRRAELPLSLAFEGEWAAALEHARIPFVSYPYEWSFGMLRDAALLQLDLMRDALNEGFVLKDASAYNVQWTGARPVFIDIPSLEPLEPGQAWDGYRQFCMMFLYPLMLQAYRDVPFQPWLRGAIDGIEPAAMARLLGWRDMLRPGVLTHVHLHARLEAQGARSQREARKSLEQAGFGPELIKANVSRLRRLVEKLEWRAATSTWSGYAESHSYESADYEKKKAFVRRAAQERHWGLAWDLGGNIGEFSRILADHADTVVLMDGDALTVEHAYRRLRAADERRILPLLMNLADPSPARGWRGAERKTLEARGAPDLVLALALIHHIVIGANVPLAEFVAWLADLGAVAVIEFVTREDEMVMQLLRNRRDRFDDYNLDNFEAAVQARFRVRDRLPLKDGKRVLYVLEPK